MSRTFRRKHFETIKGRIEGSKTNGFYTARGDYIHTGNGHSGVWVFAPMVGEQLWSARKIAHGETRGRHRSPHPFSREINEREFRQETKRELLRYYRNPEHEVLVPLKPGDVWEDWY